MQCNYSGTIQGNLELTLWRRLQLGESRGQPIHCVLLYLYGFRKAGSAQPKISVWHIMDRHEF